MPNVLNLKNAMCLRFFKVPGYLRDPQAIEEALIEKTFKECAPQQESSEGFSPIGQLCYEDGTPIHLLTVNDRYHLFCFTSEVKQIPGQYMSKKSHIEYEKFKERTGSYPSKDERNQIKDEIKAQLLPHTYPRTTHTYGYFDTEDDILVVCTNTGSVCDAVTSRLRGTLDTLPVEFFEYRDDVGRIMTEWACDAVTSIEGLEVLTDFELRLKTDDVTSIVSCKSVDAGSEEVTCHIDHGKRVSKLSLAHHGVSFVLADTGHIKNVRFAEESEAMEDQESAILAETFLFCRSVTNILSALHTAFLPVPVSEMKVA